MKFMLAFVTVMLSTSADAQVSPGPTLPPLTLQEALRRATTEYPPLRAREAELAAGEGLVQESAAPLINNPELSLQRARRRASGASGESSATDRQLGLSQRFETGGQQGLRREAARATRDAILAEIADLRGQARAEASLRFHQVLLAQRKIAIEERALALFESSAQAVARRRAAGEDTRLDANVALIEAERARNGLAAAREQLIDARAELATVLQLPLVQLPAVAESPHLPGQVAAYSLDDLFTSAQSLPRARALVAREAAARARLALESARRSPDVTVGVNLSREGPPAERERVTAVLLSVPLPVFNRNSAAIGKASAEATQAEIERTVAARDGEARIRQLWDRLSSQRDRVLRLQQAMVPAALDNQQLATRSRQAGQIGLLDQLVVSRQALDAERDLNSAITDFNATRIELERAAGWPQEGQTQ